MERVFYIIKLLVPHTVKKSIKRHFQKLKMQLAGRIGVLPDFLVIGAQKCATTSLYNYLTNHPCIYSAYKKEIGYFDRRYYSKNIKWYRSHFPSFLRKYYTKWAIKRDFITGEASTGYVLYPHALKRIAKTLPKVKLVLILRNPVDRAYSHYQHTKRGGREILSFEDAIKKEVERVGIACKKLKEDEKYFNIDIAYYAYRFIGVYIDQIKVLMSLFPKEQILILKYEDFIMNPLAVYRKTLEFLDIPNSKLKDLRKYNEGEYTKMDIKVRKSLVDYFKPYNKKLYEYLGVDFGWDR